MIGNYVFAVSVGSNLTLDKTFLEIETALKQGMIVTITGVDATAIDVSFVTVAERQDETHFVITDTERHNYTAESLDGYPMMY